jgi:hypothetical protein
MGTTRTGRTRVRERVRTAMGSERGVAKTKK